MGTRVAVSKNWGSGAGDQGSGPRRWGRGLGWRWNAVLYVPRRCLNTPALRLQFWGMSICAGTGPGHDDGKPESEAAWVVPRKTHASSLPPPHWSSAGPPFQPTHRKECRRGGRRKRPNTTTLCSPRSPGGHGAYGQSLEGILAIFLADPVSIQETPYQAGDLSGRNCRSAADRRFSPGVPCLGGIFVVAG